MNKILLTALLCLLAGFVQANIDAYDFQGDAATEQRFRTMVEELRCPKCQNSNIAGSNAPLAKDIKDRVYKMMVEEKKSDAEIMAWAEQRYGSFITYRPPLNTSTLVLWLGPLAAFIVAMTVLLIRVRKRQQSAKQAADLSTQEKAKLDSLLDRYRNSSENK